VTGLEERLRAQLVELEAAAAEVAIASSISSSLKQQVKSMAADLELQRSNAASAASMLADVQQQLQVVETAFYMRQKVRAGWHRKDCVLPDRVPAPEDAVGRHSLQAGLLSLQWCMGWASPCCRVMISCPTDEPQLGSGG
jgi:hypothetical protein